MRQRLGKRIVDAAKAPLKGSRYLWDSEVPGFALRVYKGADGVLRRIYCVRFSSKGRDCWITIGHHGSPGRPDARGNPRTLTAELAREEALRFRGIWQAGGNPREAREAGRFAGQPKPRPPCETLKAFSVRYLEKHSDLHKAWRSAREDRGYLDRHILKALGHRRLDGIGPEDVTDLQATLRSKPTTANRCVEVISSMISVAKRWKVLPKSHENPCSDLPRFKLQPRERYLTSEELARLGPAIAAENATSPYPVAALLVLAFTGARPCEILELKWEQLRLEMGHVLLLRKGRWLPLYLPGPAVAILTDLPRKDGNPYVFPGSITANHVSMGGLHTLWRRVKTAAHLEDVRPYDLRHTLASKAISAGATLEIIGGMLGHLSIATTKRYAHLAALPVRAAGESVAQEIDVAMGRTR